MLFECVDDAVVAKVEQWLIARRASIAGLLETEKSPLTTCDWVFPWCFLAKLSASPLPAAAEGFKCEGIAREAIVSESVGLGRLVSS
jgi:hypothetical protein